MSESVQSPPPDVNETAQLKAIYCNGFQLGLSTADVFIVVQQNGKNLFILNMSYTTAKTLAEKLTEMIVSLEQKSEQKIMSSEQVAGFISKGANV